MVPPAFYYMVEIAPQRHFFAAPLEIATPVCALARNDGYIRIISYFLALRMAMIRFISL